MCICCLIYVSFSTQNSKRTHTHTLSICRSFSIYFYFYYAPQNIADSFSFSYRLCECAQPQSFSACCRNVILHKPKNIINKRNIFGLFSLVTLNMNIGHVVYIPFAWNWTPHRRWTKATAIYVNACFPMLLWWTSVNEANEFMLLYQKLFQLPIFCFRLVNAIFVAILSVLVKFINYKQCILCWIFKILMVIFHADNVVHRPIDQYCTFAIHFMEISFTIENHLKRSCWTFYID